ncbi:tetratricopeptide repeat protein [Thermodesulfobacteriota bacterium]
MVCSIVATLVENDPVSADELSSLAEEGDADEQSFKEIIDDLWIDVSNPHAEAVKWFRVAAEQGDPNAQYQLGEKYLHGKGVPADREEAAKWFRRAAKNGNKDAQKQLRGMGNDEPK